MYNIKPYSFHQASLLGVVILPSKRKNKKIDIFKNQKYLCSIGDTRYSDYPSYIDLKGNEYASKRRTLYHQRHKKENVVGSPGYYALKILW